MNTQALALAGVARAELQRGTAVVLMQPSAAEITPVVLRGKEEFLRCQDEIAAVERIPDIFLGYDVELTETLFEPSAFALANGWETADTQGISGAGAMQIGDEQPMTLRLYTEEKDTSGETAEVLCFEFSGCRGRSSGWIFKDGKFMTPRLYFESRPDKGEAVLTVSSAAQA
ncbi:MAG: hypothetical protein HFE85_00215 [Clostridiales bacterium]|nr:hypothetical protein [Clostridiales bacterium]